MENDIIFTTQECEEIINLRFEYEEVLNKDFLGSYWSDFENVSYRVWNIIRNEQTQWVFDRMYKYFTQSTGIRIKKELYECHIHNYVTGEKFSKHSDTTYPTQVYNIGVCLNDNYGAGEFVLYNPDFTLPKKTGVIYSFESRREHEVKEISFGERWSLIGFFHNYHLQHNIDKII
jgi:hypothetical protein